MQSSRLLHKRLSKFLKSIGYRQLVSDQCVFVKGSGRAEVIICTWVDDIIMSSHRKNAQARDQFDKDIRSEFRVSPWTAGEAGWLLNIKIVRDWDKGTLHMSQEAAIMKLARRFGLDGDQAARPVVPMDPLMKFKKPADEDIVSKGDFDYMSAVGGLLYVSLTTRPDISYSVGVLSRFMACPGETHVNGAKQIIQYLYRTKEYGIRYSKESQKESIAAPHAHHTPEVYVCAKPGGATSPKVVKTGEAGVNGHEAVSYVDADLAGDVDTMRSTTGFAIMMHGGIVNWLSKLQPTVALSTPEAETNAATELAKQVCHLRMFLRELGLEQKYPTVVHEDNNATIAFVDGSESPKKAKHYLMKVHYLKEQKEAGLIKMQKVGTVNQLADVFTKALPKVTFQKFRDWMGVIPPAETK